MTNDFNKHNKSPESQRNQDLQMNKKGEMTQQHLNTNLLKSKIPLPIDAFQENILESIKHNPVTIVVADTGAGKSTRVPQFLLEYTDHEIVVTQPRRVAAKSVAKRVAQEMNSRFGGKVGFRTAVDRNDSIETRCLFATDGLQLIRELTKSKQTTGTGVVLIIDEVHEWNQNIETLIARAKKAINAGEDIKIVLMSATLDHERLSNFFENAPVIEVPGRCFPVIGSPNTGIAQKKAPEMLDEITRMATSGKNTLVFLPGKEEINQMQKALLEKKVQAVILPLHGELDAEEQDRVFDSYRLPKIILSTNIAQTSLTIPDIDAVVDSGLERRIELVNNVETLTLANISQADCKQRAGRAGRLREGEYVLCNNTNYAQFSAYPTPEILRSLLDQMVLRLAGVGLDATTLPFYHQPNAQVLAEAKKTLIAIEALDAQGKITKLGHKINKFPTNVEAARMIIEAVEHKCLNPVLTIASILGSQSGSLRRRPKNDDPADFKGWEELISPDKEYQSDLLVELELFWKAKEMRGGELIKNGILPKAYGQASEIRGQLREALSSLGYNFHRYNDNMQNEELILKSVAAGLVGHLYRNTGGKKYRNGDDRELAKESIINRLDKYPEWVVGEPMNIAIKDRRGRSLTLPLLKNVTAVKPEWMSEIAPHLVEKKIERLYWESNKQCVVQDHVTIFNGQETLREPKQAPWSEETQSILVDRMLNNYTGSESINELYRANMSILEQYRSYYVRSGGSIEKRDSQVVRDLYNKVLMPYKFCSFEQLIAENIPTAILTLKLEDLISTQQIQQIEIANPDKLEVHGALSPITYAESYGTFYAKIEVTEDWVFATSQEELLLPSGRQLVMRCNGYEASTIAELRKKIEANAVSQAWSLKKSEIETTSWISNPDEVLPYVQQLLSPVEIVTTRIGQKVEGYISLYSDSDPDFQIRLRDSYEVAQQETKIGLERLFEKSVRTACTVPQQEPWTGYYGRLSDLGNALKQRLDMLKASASAMITKENIRGLITSISEQATQCTENFLTEYQQASAEITKIEQKRASLIDGQHKYLVDEAQEVATSIQTLYSLLQQGQCAESMLQVQQLNQYLSTIPALILQRQEEESQRIAAAHLPDGLLERGFSGDLASAIQFMENVKKLPKRQLNSHELTCGRSRVHSHLEEVWSTMGETTGFFCGADPNDVKYYVYEYHFGGEQGYVDTTSSAVPSPKEQSYASSASSNDDMLEALRKAGLIK